MSGRLVLFNGLEFLVFLPIVWALYLGLRLRGQNLLLLCASYVFYGWWDVRFLFLIVASTAIDFVVGLLIDRGAISRRQSLVAAGWLVGGALLFVLAPWFFKYFDFFVESLELGLGQFGIDPGFMRLDLILPVGISIYTFQTMSYAIDVYRRKVDSTDNIVDFGLYVAYFPQLVAGPIERASRLLPAIRSVRRVTLDGVSRGMRSRSCRLIG